MTYTSLLTSLTWGKWRRGDVVRAKITFDRAGDEDDSCEAAFVEELGPEWLAALEAADYSDLPKLKKIHA
jgi:hypothetical protein